MSEKTVRKIQDYQVPITLGALIVSALFVISSTYSYARNEAKTVESINTNAEKVKTLEAAYKELSEKQQANENNYIEIKTKLQGIEALVIDVRERLNK